MVKGNRSAQASPKVVLSRAGYPKIACPLTANQVSLDSPVQSPIELSS